MKQESLFGDVDALRLPRGVFQQSYVGAARPYVARITIDSRRITLGSYSTPQAAGEAYALAVFERALQRFVAPERSRWRRSKAG